MDGPSFKLSPSDFAFLWDECKRCFYLKVVLGFARPAQPFPRIFGIIDLAMKKCYEGTRSEEMAPGAPAGRVKFGDGWVQSEPMGFPGGTAQCHIRGIYDTVIELDSGGFAVADFKTTAVRPASLRKYSRQLHAYALALEKPAPGMPAMAPVERLGLLVYEPSGFSLGENASPQRRSAALGGSVTWIEVKRDMDAFIAWLGTVLAVLEQPIPPPADTECKMCQYREASRRTGW
jgi:hypothetical protein